MSTSPHLGCPECHAPIDSCSPQPDRFAEKIVGALECFCPERNDGCPWIGTRAGLAAHAKECRASRVRLIQDDNSQFGKAHEPKPVRFKGWGIEEGGTMTGVGEVAREAWEGRRPKPPSSDLRSPSLAQEQCGRRTPEPFDCPWGCGESIEGGNTGLERHRDACSREPRRLMATIRQLQVQNQQLTSENRELETSSVPTWVRPSPAGPGACIE
eukprot:scaffold3558_cov60-Phaeocystis_antarctica.AAC.2